MSQSGYGGGGYPAFGIEENGEYVAFCIEFVADNCIKLECVKCGAENSGDAILRVKCGFPLEFEEELNS